MKRWQIVTSWNRELQTGKKDNTLSELQILEGIYEHLSAIEELPSRISSLSSRVSRVECSRNDSIYGALVYSIDTYKELQVHKALIEDVQTGVQMNIHTLGYIKSEQKDQIKADKEQMEEILKIKEESTRRFKVLVGMIVALMVILWVVFIVVTFWRKCTYFYWGFGILTRKYEEYSLICGLANW